MRYRQVALALLSLLFASSCVRPVARLMGKTVEIPHFIIAIRLSNEADKKPSQHWGGDQGHWVIAYFDGDALPGQARDNAPLVDENFVARFDNSSVPLSDWNRLLG
jgi:hypothetical protein